MAKKSKATREYEREEGGSKSKEILKEVLQTSIYLLIVLVVTFVIVKFVAQRTVVHGASMEPTLYGLNDRDSSVVGDNLILDKISYRFNDPKRFDIVVFPYRYGNENYIKRIIGLPGETVQIGEDGTIYIDGKALSEGYGKEIIRDPGLAANPITLGEDEYFVMGDNRNNSVDSRWAQVGNVKRSEIIGKAWVRIYPFSRFGAIK